MLRKGEKGGKMVGHQTGGQKGRARGSGRGRQLMCGVAEGGGSQRQPTPDRGWCGLCTA
jgi:hypothetical protein